MVKLGLPLGRCCGKAVAASGQVLWKAVAASWQVLCSMCFLVSAVALAEAERAG